MSTYGNSIKISIFGESHGSMIGITISNLAPGIKLDLEDIQKDLDKRKPKNKLSTPRRESDEFEIVSGFFNEFTTGTPLTFIIKNTSTKSADYTKTKDLLRPSHADYTAFKRYDGFQDYRGGGHFSGRLTACSVIIGSISKQILNRKGITVVSHISSIKDIMDSPFSSTIDNKTIELLSDTDFPVIDNNKKILMEEKILEASKLHDSIGGTVETAVIGINPGYGNPIFDSVESILSHLIFSIPAVKGVEFGLGFDITKNYGSIVNDEFSIYKNKIVTKTNNNGGINGGITNGMPITVKTALKPTPSISSPQNTVNINTMKEEILQITGRHDPCIVHRALHVINAVVAFGILDIIVGQEGQNWMK